MNKYRAQKTTVDGIRFDSKKESQRYLTLKLLQKAGLIRNLELQPRFNLDIRALDDPLGPSKRVGFYKADFRYEEKKDEGWQEVVEDAKGLPTSTYRLKKRLTEALYTIVIQET